MAVNRTFDFTAGARQVGSEEPTPAALLQPKPRFNWNPFSYLWTGMQHVAYFFAPPNGCVYCWLWRMFFVGSACGAVLAHWLWK